MFTGSIGFQNPLSAGKTIAIGAGAMSWRLDNLKWIGAAFCAALFYSAYCQVHGWVDAIETPFSVSLRWGALAGIASIFAARIIWHYRMSLFAMSARRISTRLFISAALAASVLVAGSIIHMSVASWTDILPLIVRKMFDLLPLSAALGLLAFATLSFVKSLLSARAQTKDLWIAMPEEPTLRLRALDVRLIRSAGNYCEFFADDRCHLVRVPMKTMASRLKGSGFVQIHRTAIVNSHRIKRVAKDRQGCLGAYLDTGDFVAAGRSFKQHLLKIS